MYGFVVTDVVVVVIVVATLDTACDLVNCAILILEELDLGPDLALELSL